MYKTVLCIDPSLKQSGIAVVKDGAVVYKATASGLSGNFNIIKNIIKTYKPDLIIKESPYCGPNKITFRRLSEVHGCIQLLAELYNIPVKEYTPSVGKKVAGTSTRDKDSKDKVNKFVNDYFNISIINNDITDALVLYIAYVKEG